MSNNNFQDRDIQVIQDILRRLSKLERQIHNVSPGIASLIELGGTTNHLQLTNIGTNTHAQLDTHLSTEPAASIATHASNANAHHNKSHIHDGADGSGSVSHANLGSVSSDQHHAKSHAHDGADGSGSIAHSSTSGQTANDHHAKSHAHDGADGSGSIAHSSLSGIGASDHHTKYTDAEAKAAAVSDTAYNATSWDAVTDVAPSKNAVRDKIEAIETEIAGVSTPALASLTDINFTSIADEDLIQYDSTTSKFINQTIAQIMTTGLKAIWIALKIPLVKLTERINTTSGGTYYNTLNGIPVIALKNSDATNPDLGMDFYLPAISGSNVTVTITFFYSTSSNASYSIVHRCTYAINGGTETNSSVYGVTTDDFTGTTSSQTQARKSYSVSVPCDSVIGVRIYSDASNTPNLYIWGITILVTA